MKPLLLNTQFFRVCTQERQAEQDHCFRSNLQHPAVDQLALLREPDAPELPGPARKAVQLVKSTARLSYATWVLKLKEEPEAIAILINSGIALGYRWEHIENLFDSPKSVLALSTHKSQGSGEPAHLNYFPHWAQVIWALRRDASIPDSLLHASKFPIGFPDSDNRITVSSTCWELQRKGYTQLLIAARQDLNLEEAEGVRAWYAGERPEVVVLADAKVWEAYASDTFLADFLLRKLKILNKVIESAWRSRMRRRQLPDSNCIYPKFAEFKLCQALRQQHWLDTISLMPTNTYGPRNNLHPENGYVMPAIIHHFHKVKTAETPNITGWGTQMREFLHVDDLEETCVFVPEHYSPDPSEPVQPLNGGNGVDLTIWELAELMDHKAGYMGEILWVSSKPDGTPKKQPHKSRLAALGWRASIPLSNAWPARWSTLPSRAAGGYEPWIWLFTPSATAGNHPIACLRLTSSTPQPEPSRHHQGVAAQGSGCPRATRDFHASRGGREQRTHHPCQVVSRGKAPRHVNGPAAQSRYLPRQVSGTFGVDLRLFGNLSSAHRLQPRSGWLRSQFLSLKPGPVDMAIPICPSNTL